MRLPTFFRERESGTVVADEVTLEALIRRKAERRATAAGVRQQTRGVPRYIRRNFSGGIAERSAHGHLTRRERKVVARSIRLLARAKGAKV